MKPSSPELLALIPQAKTINARATFRVMRPQFAVSALANPLAITDPSQIDSCSYGTGILRVTNVDGTLYTQNIPDVLSAWPAWVDTGIAIMDGSRPGVDGGYVWYQKPDGLLYFRDFSNWGVENVGRGDGNGYPEVLAPISNLRCYSIYFLDDEYIMIDFSDVADENWTSWPGTLWGITDLRLDAVNYSDGIDGKKDYLYFSNRDAGRIMELSYNVDTFDWGTPRSIVSIDAIDDVYGLKLHGASVLDGKVVVTGRLTRTSDGDPVSMDVYLIGPENFTFGRDMFISGTHIGGPMLLAGSQLVVSGHNQHAEAIATNLFGVDTGALKLTTSDIENIQLQEAENRSSVLAMSMSPALSHAAIGRGSQVILEVAYDDEWMTAFTGEISRTNRSRSAGESFNVEVVSSTAKRLSQWSPEQGIHVPSQKAVITTALDPAQIIRAVGKYEDANTEWHRGTVYNEAHASWVYSGTWGNWINPSNTNNVKYSDAAGAHAEFAFTGTGFIFTYTIFSDRGIHDIYVDGVKIASVNAYGVARTRGHYISPQLAYGAHTFKVIRGTGGGYIDVDQIEIVNYTPDTLKPRDLNNLEIIYTVAEATGGIMRGRFYNATIADTTQQNPRFGVGLNYLRETRVDAAARLGVEYDDVTDDLLTHNGLIAIYGRKEVSNAPGIKLYKMVNSVLHPMFSTAVSLPDGQMVWLQIRFVAGHVTISYRSDASADWVTALNFVPNWEWDMEGAGHGWIAMERVTPYTYCEAFTDTGEGWGTLGVDSTTMFTYGDYVQVDDEVMGYIIISGAGSSPNGVTYGPFSIVEDRYYQTSSGLPGGGYSRALTLKGGRPAVYFKKAVCIISGGGAGQSFIDDNAFSAALSSHWVATNYAFEDWRNHIGDGAYGAWVATPSDEWVAGIQYSDPDLVKSDPRVLFDKDTQVLYKDGIYATFRGLQGSISVSHPERTKVSKYADVNLYVDKVEFFSQDEDIALSDGLRRVIHLAGGEFTDKLLIDQVQSIVAADDWTIVAPATNEERNFIAEILLPKNIPSGQLIEIGMVFRSSIVPSAADFDGYFVGIRDNKLILRNLNAATILETIPIYGSYPHGGRLKISVHENCFAVWLNHVCLHSFASEVIPASDAEYAAFAVYNPNNVAIPDIHVYWTELNELLSDVTVGVRGQGMSVVGEMTNNRRVFFRCEPDGGLYFYKSPTDIGTLPDIVIAEQIEETDEQLSRVRMEGIKIVEIADFTRLSDIGNLFETANSMYADTVTDLAREGAYYIKSLRQRSEIRTLETVFHPALQPGDVATVDIGGEEVEIGIMSTKVSIGFSGDNFEVAADLQAYTP